MTADHREIEDKYDLDASTVLPDLLSLKGVRSVATEEQELVAAYFDTAGLALAQAGVVLRRRTGGADPGWHLKLPMDGARLEITVPLGRAVRTPRSRYDAWSPAWCGTTTSPTSSRSGPTGASTACTTSTGWWSQRCPTTGSRASPPRTTSPV